MISAGLMNYNGSQLRSLHDRHLAYRENLPERTNRLENAQPKEEKGLVDCYRQGVERSTPREERGRAQNPALDACGHRTGYLHPPSQD
jgi:hypothetical protein